MPDEEAPEVMLQKARQSARKLVTELKTNYQEVQADPPNIPASQLAQGREAMQRAIAAAERTLAALEAAASIDQRTNHQSHERIHRNTN